MFEYQIRKIQQTSRKGMQLLVSNSTNIIVHGVYLGKQFSSLPGWACTTVSVNCDKDVHSCIWLLLEYT